MLLRRWAGGGFVQLDGGAAVPPSGWERCLLSLSNGDLPEEGVCGGPVEDLRLLVESYNDGWSLESMLSERRLLLA